MKSEKAMSHMGVVIAIVVIIAVAIIGIKVVLNLNEERLIRNLSTDMLLVQGKIRVIAYEHEVDKEENPYVGEKVSEHLDDPAIKQLVDNKVIDPEEEGFEDHYYMIDINTFEDLNLHVDLEDDYYIVNYATGEVIYPTGMKIEGVMHYTLTSILEHVKEENKDDKKQTETNEEIVEEVNEEA